MTRYCRHYHAKPAPVWHTIQQTLDSLSYRARPTPATSTTLMQEIAVTNAQQSATAGHLAERMALISAKFEASSATQIESARRRHWAACGDEASHVASLAQAFEVEQPRR